MLSQNAEVGMMRRCKSIWKFSAAASLRWQPPHRARPYMNPLRLSQHHRTAGERERRRGGRRSSAFNHLQDMSNPGKQQLDFIGMAFEPELGLPLFNDKFHSPRADRVEETVRLEQVPHTVGCPCLLRIVLLDKWEILADDAGVDGRPADAVGSAIDNKAAQKVVAFDLHSDYSFGEFSVLVEFAGEQEKGTPAI
jgi:hypothetical protein